MVKESSADPISDTSCSDHYTERIIGTLNEKSVHRTIKTYIDPDPSHHEKECCGCIVDILDGRSVFEIQTGSFSYLKNKLPRLLDNGYSVTVVYPIAAKKTIRRIDPLTGEAGPGRISPKKGNRYHILIELVHILGLLDNENLHFRIVFTDVTEYRLNDESRRVPYKREKIIDTVPCEVLSEFRIDERKDFSYLVPDSLPDVFSVSDFAKASKMTVHRAYAALKVLKTVAAVKTAGKSGRRVMYSRL